jgi:hypothetical protein
MAFRSSRKKSGSTSFRPSIESLEGRWAPSIGAPEPPPDGASITSDESHAGPPTATLGASVAGKVVTVTFTDQADPQYTDDEAGFQYSYAFEGENLDLVEKTDSASATFKYKDKGSHTIHARIYNKDGLFAEYHTTVQVKVKPIFVTGADAGGGPHVKVFDHKGVVKHSFYAYDPYWAGGVAVAKGDFNDDGVLDIVTAAGPGGGPHVRVFDGKDLSELASFYAYDADFHGGVTIAVGDLNGDGRVDLITGMAVGGSIVQGIDGTKLDKMGTADEHEAMLHMFNAFPTDPGGPSIDLFPGQHMGGVNVASGDINKDGHDDIIAGMASFGGQVKIFSGKDALLIRGFAAFGPFNKNGVTVAAGDVDGDGHVDILLGQDSGNGAQLRMIRGHDGRLLHMIVPFFFSSNANSMRGGIFGGIPNGVRAALIDLDGDGADELIVSSRSGYRPRVRVFTHMGGKDLHDFDAYHLHFTGGVNVG